MIINILYSIFFGLINSFLFLKFQKSTQFTKGYLFYLFVSIVVFSHLGVIKISYLMGTQDFLNLSFFSGALVVFHFATNIQVALFKKYNTPQNEQGYKLQSSLLLVFDFMRQKLIYIMIYIYQLLAVWDESFR